jgi:hypothetical protein
MLPAPVCSLINDFTQHFLLQAGHSVNHHAMIARPFFLLIYLKKYMFSHLAAREMPNA